MLLTTRGKQKKTRRNFRKGGKKMGFAMPFKGGNVKGDHPVNIHMMNK